MENTTSVIYETLNFNVKGVTFNNEEGKNIQNEIRKIFLEYEKNGCFEKYSGYADSEIKEFGSDVSEFEDAKIEMKLKEDVFEGKSCIKVYIKRYDDSYCHVGYIPANLVKKYLKLKKDYKEIKQEIRLVGGKCKTVEYDILTDKPNIEILELNYGFEVSLIFYNDEILYKEKIATQRKKAIAEYEKRIKETEEKERENRKLRKEEIKGKERKTNISTFIIITIISAPFVWMFWKILSFIFWLLE